MDKSHWFEAEKIVRSAVRILTRTNLQTLTYLALIDATLGWNRCTFTGSSTDLIVGGKSHRSSWGLNCNRKSLSRIMKWFWVRNIAFTTRVPPYQTCYYLNIPGILKLYVRWRAANDQNSEKEREVLAAMTEEFDNESLQHPDIMESEVKYRIENWIGKTPPKLKESRKRKATKIASAANQDFTVSSFIDWLEAACKKENVSCVWWGDDFFDIQEAYDDKEWKEENELELKKRTARIKRLFKEFTTAGLKKYFMDILENHMSVLRLLELEPRFSDGLEEAVLDFELMYRYRRYIKIYLKKDRNPDDGELYNYYSYDPLEGGLKEWERNLDYSIGSYSLFVGPKEEGSTDEEGGKRELGPFRI